MNGKQGMGGWLMVYNFFSLFSFFLFFWLEASMMEWMRDACYV